MTSLYLLGVDPGKTTGVCLMEVPEDEPAKLLYWVETPSSPNNLMTLLYGYQSVCEGAEIIVVMEDWDSRKTKFVPDARQACEPIGMVKMLCYQMGVKVVMQRPQQRLTIPDTAKLLKPLGYWIPGSKGKGNKHRGDARQAERHCLSHAIHTQKHLPTTLHVFPRTV